MIPAWTATIGALAWGAVWGSFGNVLVHRWPRGESLVRPGSRCPACGVAIRWYDNVPVLSYLALGGRCRDCGAVISLRYPLMEATCAALAVGVWYRLASAALADIGAIDPATIGRFLIEFQVLWGLVVVSLVDFETLLVPDVVVVPLAGLAMAGQFLFEDGRPWLHLGTAAVGYLMVRVVFVAGWKALTGREGMGMGDGKILALLGAHLGPGPLPFVLVAGSIQGLLYVLATVASGRSPTPAGAGEPPASSLRETKIPFGPFLALAAIEAVFLAPIAAPWVADTPGLRVLFGFG